MAEPKPQLHPFRISVPQDAVDDLKDRLRNTRWPDQIDGTGWDYGTDLSFLRELCRYWAEDFDWAAVVKRLNSWEQVVTELDGQRIHAIVARSPEADALPLLLTHGWPGSITEFLEVIDPLRDPASHGGSSADAFHVVVPSLPGFGWSGPTRSKGWDVARIAATWAELMSALGYERYGAQGGDWGSFVSTWLALAEPERVAGIHLNMAIGFPAGGPADDQEAADLASMTEFLATGCAYQEVQGKNPQTLAYGLNDSPAGLAGWIVEKFYNWTDNKGLPTDAVSLDQICANLSTYWFTGTIGSSTRIYLETMRSGRWATHPEPVAVPTGWSRFPAEITRPPLTWVQAGYNLTWWRRHDSGGHFAALEQPEALITDIRDFFRTVR